MHVVLSTAYLVALATLPTRPVAVAAQAQRRDAAAAAVFDGSRRLRVGLAGAKRAREFGTHADDVLQRRQVVEQEQVTTRESHSLSRLFSRARAGLRLQSRSVGHYTLSLQITSCTYLGNSPANTFIHARSCDRNYAP